MAEIAVLREIGSVVKSRQNADSKPAEADDSNSRLRTLEKLLQEERCESQRFRTAFDAAPSGIILVGDAGEIVMANEKAEELFGYDSGRMEGVRVDQLVPDSIHHRHEDLRAEFHNHPEARPMGAGRDLSAKRKDGTEFPVEIGLTPVASEEGDLVLAVIVDISERKAAEAALRERAQILESVHDAVFLVSPVGEIRTWNPGAEAVFGWPGNEIIGKNISELLPPGDPGRFADRIYPRVCRDQTFEFSTPCRHRDGRELSLAIRASLFGNPDDTRGAIICANDITRQKQLEEEILQISENEQRRIGQDIHDDLCQQLAGIGCLTQVLQQQFREISESGANSLNQIGEMVAQANVKAREISRGLAPAVIEREGLPGALEDLAQRTRKIFGIKCAFQCPDPVLGEDEKVALQFYRIAQEAVGNAVKHGDATRIDIRLELHGGKLALIVTDNGRGIPKGSSGNGLGLMTMARRAEILEGDLDIHSSADDGTRITCSAPHQQ